MDKLLTYDWPGKVRELENVMERVVIRSRGAKLEQNDLPLKICCRHILVFRMGKYGLRRCKIAWRHKVGSAVEESLQRPIFRRERTESMPKENSSKGTTEKEVTLTVPGMGSDHCAGIVRTSLERLDGEYQHQQSSRACTHRR
ncbi:hypothetical protein SAMN05660860_01871 [Geoalkalibacter ferrihydriticus]|nr:hypothetical protein SAMN05660860_01871 [Geoalkalibacter ferrihydriticus]